MIAATSKGLDGDPGQLRRAKIAYEASSRTRIRAWNKTYPCRQFAIFIPEDSGWALELLDQETGTRTPPNRSTCGCQIRDAGIELGRCSGRSRSRTSACHSADNAVESTVWLENAAHTRSESHISVAVYLSSGRRKDMDDRLGAGEIQSQTPKKENELMKIYKLRIEHSTLNLYSVKDMSANTCARRPRSRILKSRPNSFKAVLNAECLLYCLARV
jgi:hypothetical protein